jgi:4-hydroxy-tetrahydrodipicolinate synthase
MVPWYSKEQTNKFEGVFSLLLTPFFEDGSINWNTYERYVDWQLEQNPHGLFGVCGSSEMKWLHLDERLQLSAMAVKRAGNTPVVVTANLDPNIEFHQEEVQRLADTGVAGVVLVPPPGLGKNQSQLGEYFAALADRAPCPVFIYEWPMVDHYMIGAHIYADLATHHNVWGLKDTTCTLETIRAKIQAAPNSVVYQANHPFMLDAIHSGARGIMAISSAACTEQVVTFWSAAKSGLQEAERLHEDLVILDSILIHGNGYPATAKHLAKLMGMDLGMTCRNPVVLRGESAKAVEIWHAKNRREVQ